MQVPSPSFLAKHLAIGFFFALLLTGLAYRDPIYLFGALACAVFVHIYNREEDQLDL